MNIGPFEVDQIYNMDCFDALGMIPPSKIDLLLTDPPYNIGFQYSSYQDSLTEDEYINMLKPLADYSMAIISYPEETMRYVVPACGVPDEVLVWCYNSNLPRQSRLVSVYGANVNYKNVLQPYKNPTDRRVKRLIANGSTGTRSYDWFSDIQLEKNVSKKDYPHPCPVPVKLMERIILLTTRPGDVVMDPFMGSGTTAIACIRTGRHFIGFEIDDGYCAMANGRIDGELTTSCAAW